MKIAIIGAGPRGILALERIVTWKKKLNNNNKISINIFDPYSIGGRVWKIDQPQNLIMNTASQHITLFYDRTIDSIGPLNDGPSLYLWAKTEANGFIKDKELPEYFLDEISNLGPNDYSSRALFGVYILWYFNRIISKLPEDINVNIHNVEITDIENNNGFFLRSKGQDFKADKIIMSLGNLPNQLNKYENELTEFSKKNNLMYVTPGFPDETDLSKISPNTNVILRGLGLSFFDYVSMLTEGKNGKFVKDGKNLKYIKSGLEPKIIAGSRRGFPYHAKGLNQKEAGEELKPHFLTPAFLNRFSKSNPIPATIIIENLKHEIEYIYYNLLIQNKYPSIDYFKFENEFLQSPERTIDKYIINNNDILNWEEIQHPDKFTDNNNYDEFMINYLQNDYRHAKIGTKTDPLSSAFEVLRDLRSPIRTILNRKLISDDDYIQVSTWFNSLINFLSIGPPAIRIQQLIALMKANIVKILPPNIEIEMKNKHFVAIDSLNSNEYPADYLIEARLPAINASTTTSKLLTNLQKNELARPYYLRNSKNEKFNTGAVQIDLDSNKLLAKNGKIIDGIYFWGVPTEGQNWLTTASPKPFVNDISLKLANEIITDIFSK